MGVQFKSRLDSSPCPRSSLSLPALQLSLLLSQLSPSQDTTSWRSSAAPSTRLFCVLGKLKLPGTTAGTLLISRVVLLGSWELLTVDFVSVMCWDGWDSWSARWTQIYSTMWLSLVNC